MTLAHTLLGGLLSLNPRITDLGEDRMLATWIARNKGMVMGRIFDGEDGGDSGPFTIYSVTNPVPFYLDAQALPSGETLVAWVETLNRTSTSVKAQWLDAEGRPRGEVLTLGAMTSGDIRAVQTVLSNDGQPWLVWNWQEPGRSVLYGQALDGQGHPMGEAVALLSQEQTASYRTSEYVVQSVGENHFVVAWLQDTTVHSRDDGTYSVHAQVFALDGSAVGGPITLSGDHPRVSSFSVADMGNGQFQVVWTGANAGATYPDIARVYSQRFGLDGVPQSDLVTVSTTPGSHYQALIQPLDNGRSVVVWHDFGRYESLFNTGMDTVAIRAQILAADGSRLGAEIVLDRGVYGEAFFDRKDVAALGDGSFVVVWETSAGVHLSRLDHNGTIATPLRNPQAELKGTAGADVLASTEGVRTRIDGLGSADHITGSSNIDTVVLDLTQAELLQRGFALQGDTLSVNTAQGTTILRQVERIALQDTVLALDTALPVYGQTDGGHVGQVYALFSALMDRLPTQQELSIWVHKADGLGDYQALAENMLQTLKPGADATAVVQLLFQNITGRAPDQPTTYALLAVLGAGKPFESPAAFLAGAAGLAEVTAPLLGIVGSVQALVPDLVAA